MKKEHVIREVMNGVFHEISICRALLSLNTVANGCDLCYRSFLRHSEDRNYDEKIRRSIRKPEHTQAVDMHLRDATHLYVETIVSVLGMFSW